MYYLNLQYKTLKREDVNRKTLLTKKRRQNKLKINLKICAFLCLCCVTVHCHVLIFILYNSAMSCTDIYIV